MTDQTKVPRAFCLDPLIAALRQSTAESAPLADLMYEAILGMYKELHGLGQISAHTLASYTCIHHLFGASLARRTRCTYRFYADRKCMAVDEELVGLLILAENC